jgi:hypothetical protein
MTRASRTTSARSFLMVAAGHMEAARLVFPRVGQVPNRAVFFAFYNVLGFAIGLYFKAYLVSRGMTTSQLASKIYGHNLTSLLEKATELGLFDVPGRGNVDRSALERIVEIVGPPFGDMRYRYIDEDNNKYTYISSMEYVWPILEDLQGRIEISLNLADVGVSHDELVAAAKNSFHR